MNTQEDFMMTKSTEDNTVDQVRALIELMNEYRITVMEVADIKLVKEHPPLPIEEEPVAGIPSASEVDEELEAWMAGTKKTTGDNAW